LLLLLLCNSPFSGTKDLVCSFAWGVLEVRGEGTPLLVVNVVLVLIRVAFLITEPLVLITLGLFDNLGVFSQMTGPLECFSLLPSDAGTY
jgi:hypothetical protein